METIVPAQASGFECLLNIILWRDLPSKVGRDPFYNRLKLSNKSNAFPRFPYVSRDSARHLKAVLRCAENSKPFENISIVPPARRAKYLKTLCHARNVTKPAAKLLPVLPRILHFEVFVGLVLVHKKHFGFLGQWKIWYRPRCLPWCDLAAAFDGLVLGGTCSRRLR